MCPFAAAATVIFIFFRVEIVQSSVASPRLCIINSNGIVNQIEYIYYCALSILFTSHSTSYCISFDSDHGRKSKWITKNNPYCNWIRIWTKSLKFYLQWQIRFCIGIKSKSFECDLNSDEVCCAFQCVYIRLRMLWYFIYTQQSLQFIVCAYNSGEVIKNTP